MVPAEDADILGLAACNPLVRDRGRSVHAPVPLAPEDGYNPDIKIPHLLRPREDQNQLPGAQLSPDLCWYGQWALNFPHLSPLFISLLTTSLLPVTVLVGVLLC